MPVYVANGFFHLPQWNLLQWLTSLPESGKCTQLTQCNTVNSIQTISFVPAYEVGENIEQQSW